MTRPELKALLRDIRKVRVAVLGDFCLDAYWLLDLKAGEISRETGLRVRSLRWQRYAPGGASNVVNNMIALGCRRVHALGVLGNDPWGPELVRQLGGIGADTAGLVTQPAAWSTPVFVKPHVGKKEQPRYDTADFNRLSPATRRNLLRRLAALLPRVDVVVINQQIRENLHGAAMRKALSAFIARHPGKTVIADSRDYAGSYSRAVLKLDEHAALRCCGVRTPPREVPVAEAKRSADILYRRSGRPVFITRGCRGCLVRDAAGLHMVPAIRVAGETDTVGAGDSMLAGIALALGAGRGPVAAAALGNYAAAVTVKKLRQTGTATPAEILSLV